MKTDGLLAMAPPWANHSRYDPVRNVAPTGTAIRRLGSASGKGNGGSWLRLPGVRSRRKQPLLPWQPWWLFEPESQRPISRRSNRLIKVSTSVLHSCCALRRNGVERSCARMQTHGKSLDQPAPLPVHPRQPAHGQRRPLSRRPTGQGVPPGSSRWSSKLPEGSYSCLCRYPHNHDYDPFEIMDS